MSLMCACTGQFIWVLQLSVFAGWHSALTMYSSVFFSIVMQHCRSEQQKVSLEYQQLLHSSHISHRSLFGKEQYKTILMITVVHNGIFIHCRKKKRSSCLILRQHLCISLSRETKGTSISLLEMEISFLFGWGFFYYIECELGAFICYCNYSREMNPCLFSMHMLRSYLQGHCSDSSSKGYFQFEPNLFPYVRTNVTSTAV